MKKLKNLISFLTSIFILYIITTTTHQIITDNKLYEKEKEIIFYKVYFLSKNLLEEIFKKYKEINDIKYKEKFVIEHLDKNLTFLKNKVGNKYHIFITDKNFVIKKTTFKYDKNFSLAFAKDLFYKYKDEIRISLPICEPATTNFFTYAYKLVENRGIVVQVGYILDSKKIEKLKIKLKKSKKKILLLKI